MTLKGYTANRKFRLNTGHCKKEPPMTHDYKQFKRRIIITGGAGFIGSHTVRHFVKNYPDYLIINFDKLTYAGNLENLKDIENYPNYVFVKGDVADEDIVRETMEKYHVDSIIHLAAESHVDRSILNPMEFVRTNVVGTVTLLNVARHLWEKWGDIEKPLFYHISTDEVYGSLGKEGKFTEETPYDPRSPYSASKASSDHFVRAYHHTYGMPVLITNCSNNYGPYQFPEKLIPLVTLHFAEEKPVPVYGTGENVRDWLYVEDHAKAIDLVFHKGKIGETYNIGAENEWRNIDLVHKIGQIVDELLGRPQGYYEKFITFVKDRPGHDFRYALDTTKIRTELGWKPTTSFEDALKHTIKWYLTNKEWVNRVRSGEYAKYYQEQYGERLRNY